MFARMIKKVQRADGTRFQVYGKVGGRKKYLGTVDSRKDAIALDEDHRSKQRRIIAGELPADHDEQRTFAAAVAIWLKMLADTNARSADEYQRRAAGHLIPEFGTHLLHEIRKPHVVSWRDRLSTELAAATVNTLLGTLSSAFSWFVDQQWIERNPCSRIRQIQKPATVFPWLSSSEQITRLLGECPPQIRSLVAVLVGTGMRLDEGLHLHWDDIDLEHRLITVHRGRKGMPKSGRLRRVPVFDSVMPVLREMRLARGSATGMLWPGRKPGKAKNKSVIWKQFKPAVERAGLDGRLRLHDLRHSFASLFLLDGGDIFKLSRILGHSSVTITERTYAHLRPDAFEEDYGRVRFAMPRDGAEVVAIGARR